MRPLKDDECDYMDRDIDDNVIIGQDENTFINFSIQPDGKYVIWAGGDIDGTPDYYPKYCPECGRKL